MPEDYRRRFNEWCSRNCEDFDEEYADCPDDIDRDVHIEEGWRLAWELKDVYDDSLIVYRFLLPGDRPRTPKWKEIPLDDKFRVEGDHHDEGGQPEMDQFQSFDAQW